MELGTLGIALVVVIGVPLITAGYASWPSACSSSCRSAGGRATGHGSGWRPASPS